MPFDRRMLKTIALSMTSGIALTAAATSSGYADGGKGGDAYAFGNPSFVAGGTGGGEGAAGQAGSPYSWYQADAGAGGGGGGAGGGIGGFGGISMDFAGGAAGQNGTTAVTPYVMVGAAGGGGGNGGNHGGSLSGLQAINGAMAGTAGGNGGNGGDTSNMGSAAGGAGGGGAGGYGLVMSGASSVQVMAGSASVTGGDGGAGGRGGNTSAGTSYGGNAGSGGDGGSGIQFIDANAVLTNAQTVRGGNGGAGGAGGASAGATGASGGNGANGGNGVQFDAAGGTVTNSGAIQGGDGALGGAGGSGSTNGGAGLGGAGGVGIIGADLRITNSGSIVGGLGADGTRADAITFTGGANTLTLAGTGSLTGNIGIAVAGSSLTFNQTTDATLASAITGLGGIVQNGTGKLTLTGTSTYTGATTVDGGTLSVNGDITSSSLTTVNAGGTLGGNGTVGNTTINGGTLAPGNSIGLLTVQGNLVLTSASTYLVEVSPASADRVNVTGMATLGNATVNASFAAGSYVDKKYTIVNAAGSVTGTFGTQVSTNLPTNFKSSLSYDTNNAYLDLALDFTPTPGAPSFGGGLSGNQGNVGNALTGFFNRTGGIPLVFGSLDAKGLLQVSGETTTASQQTSVDIMNMFMMQMTDPFAVGRGDVAVGINAYANEAMAYAPKRAATDAFASMHRKAPVLAPQERWNVWASGFGGSQTTDGNAAAGSNNSKSSIYGTAVGADYWFSPLTVAGVSMAGGGTNFSVAGGGSGRSDLLQVGGFIRHTIGSTYISAAAAYGWQDITTDRVVTVAGLDQLRAKFNASTYSGRIEAGNRFVLPSMSSWVGGLGLMPYGAVQVTAFDLPSYAESVVAGANTFALAYSGKTITATRTEFGFRTDKSFAVNDAILILRGRAAWAHDFNTDRSASATFQSLPGASFVVNGAALARNAALTTASAEFKWMNGWSIAGTFEGEFSDVTKSYAGKGVVRYAW